MDMTVRDFDATCVIDVSGSVDVYNAHELKDAVCAMVDGRRSAVILNMKKATRLDSSGMGVLISLNATLRRNGVSFYVVGVPQAIMQILEITRTISLLSVEDSVLGALSAIGSARAG